MFSQIFDAIEEWMRELLTGMITSNLDTMFTDVNQKTGEIATQVGQTPQGWNGSIFSMIRNLSDSVIMPIAGIIITLVLCYELISMLTERNNMHDIDQDGLSSMLITNEMMKEYGVTQEQIHEDAMKSSPRVMVPEVSSIGVLIDEIYQKNILMLTPDEREMLLETLQESSEMPTFFVVTNTERVNGAGVIFYPEFMDNMGELLGNNFFILPSSIHQMLILPDDGQVDAEMLRDMVKEVNATQVAPAERLTNDVYHFDTKDHVFEKADRFTERQKEKEAQAAKTEKVGKEQPDQKPKTKKHDMEL